MYKTDQITAAWRQGITSLAETWINPAAAEREQNATFDRPVWGACADAGLAGLTVPKAYGGQGLGALGTVKVLELLGYASEDPGLNFGLAAHLLAVVAPIMEYGTQKQQAHYLPALADGTLIGGNAITEASAGSDVFEMQTRAKASKHGYILNGTKTYCSNGKWANLILTYAITDEAKGFFGGVSAFLVEEENDQFRRSEEKMKLGLRSCSLAEIIFEDTLVAGERMLGQTGGGAQIFNRSMEWERTCLGAIHLGAMDKLLELASEFANQRFSGATNLSAHQAVSHPLANLKVQLEGARLLTYRAAEMLDQGVKGHTFAAMAKLAVSECYRDLTMQLMQLFAGKAYQTPNLIERHLRAALGATLYSGTSEIQRNLIARGLGLRARKR